MNDPLEGTDFVKALLAQDPLLKSLDFKQRRVKLLERLDRAERRERLSRRITIGVSVVSCVGFVLFYAVAIDAIGDSNAWPDWLTDLAAVTFILLPMTVLPLVALYFFRHRRELARARTEAQEQALLALQVQLEDLKRRLPPEEPGGELVEAGGEGGSKPPRSDAGREVPLNAGKGGGRGGFTLVELLAAISILAVLAGLVFPALRTAKSRSKTTVCQNNLGQLGRALAMYVGEFHRYPGTCVNPLRPGYPPTVNSATRVGTFLWDDLLLPYFARNASLMVCPAHVPSAYERLCGDYKADYSYGYNALGSGGAAPMQNLGLGQILMLPDGKWGPAFTVAEDRVVAPTEMIAIADRQGGEDAGTSLVLPGFVSHTSAEDPANHHLGGANALFCDSHVVFARQPEWKAETETGRRRWNNDHQPHLESLRR